MLIAFLLYLDQFFTPLQQLSMVFDQWIQARVSLRRIRELLATPTGTLEPLAPRDPALPLGYWTPIASSAHGLSAGQRQLLCLARAELVNPALLILDEATSNLDLSTEAELQRAMRRLTRGRTTLLIAHRLQTARAADRIVVVEDGLLVEQGSHRELIAAGGRYAQLWDAFHRAERSWTGMSSAAARAPLATLGGPR